MEIWKDVVGYEGLYQVSNVGAIRSLDRKKTRNKGKQKVSWKMKTPILRRKDGYLQINLWKDGEVKTEKVHRIVARAFLGCGEEGQQINHKDWDRTNNRAENLEWCDAKYNAQHKSPEAMSKAGGWCGKDRRRPIRQKTICGEFVAVYESAADARRVTGFDSSHIIAVARGKKKSYKGYVWEYDI